MYLLHTTDHSSVAQSLLPSHRTGTSCTSLPVLTTPDRMDGQRLQKQPVYLHSMLAASIPSRLLRSNNDNSLSVARVKTNTGARAFHSCAPSLWDNLPLSVRSASLVATFEKFLKTHLFDLAFAP